MNQSFIKLGLAFRLSEKSKDYRILSVSTNMICLCAMNTSKMEFLSISPDTLENWFTTGKAETVEENIPIVDKYLLPDNEREYFERKLKACTAIFSHYKYDLDELSSKKSKPYLEDVCQEVGISRQVMSKIFLRYLQSGLREYALLDHRVLRKLVSGQTKGLRVDGHSPRSYNGKNILDEADFKNMDRYVKKYLKCEIKSQTQAYLDMIDDKYSKWIKILDESGNEILIRKPVEHRPTIRQFRYHLSIITTDKQRKEAKKGKRVVRNDMRAHRGTVRDGVRGPAHIVEVDAQEMDIALVSSEYPDIPVGRPILYIMIDVFSEQILGASLAMDNNSIVGLTNCFASLVEDKKELFRKYGVSFPVLSDGTSIDEIWPTNIKPKVVRYDNGSDFVSNDMRRILNELNIDARFVPPGTGSMKPLVENFFKTVKTSLDDLLAHKGLIRSTYGSKHHEEACLTYEDAYQVVLNHIATHNCHPLVDFTLPAQMKAKKIIPSPVNLWRYGCEEMLEPDIIPDRDEFLYHLMLPAKAKLSKMGIKRSGLTYFNSKDKELESRMVSAGTSRQPFECRYDPRDMGRLYYLKNGALQVLTLPKGDPFLASYFGMSEKRYRELQDMNKDTSKKAEELKTQLRINERRKNRELINQRKKENPEQHDKKGIKDSRKEEKEVISGNNSFAERFGLDKGPFNGVEIPTDDSVAEDSASNPTQKGANSPEKMEPKTPEEIEKDIEAHTYTWLEDYY
ncbi:MAG: hypothetical protein ACI32F_06450 [Allobaculum sp.]